MLQNKNADEDQVITELYPNEPEDHIENSSISPVVADDRPITDEKEQLLNATVRRRKPWFAAAIVGVIALLCVLCALLLKDRFANEDVDGDIEQTGDATTQDQDSTEGDQGREDQQPVSVDLVIRQAELSCLLNDEDIQDFNAYLLLVEQKAMQETVTQEDVDILDEKFLYLEEQVGVAQILYYCDLTNEDASKLYLDYTEKVTQANNDYIEMLRRIYLSDSSAKEIFFAEWTDTELSMLIAYTDEVMELTQRNSEISVAYQKLQGSENMFYDMIPLYLEMVQNNNRIANIYGYDNYYDCAYSVTYNRDYGSDEIEVLREYIGIYLPEILDCIYFDLVDGIGKMNPIQQEKLNDFLYGSYSETHLEGYLSSLPEQARTEMLTMFDGNILLIDDDNAMEGAFTSDLNSDRLICYFGPGYDNTFTVIHELGHYYAGRFIPIGEISLDLAETHSQGNEWLFMSYLQDIMSADVHQLIAQYQLYNSLATTLVSVIVDEFEERIYTHPDVASLTNDDLVQIMNEVCEGYGGIDFVNSITNVNEYWRLVVIEQPVYYISYGVSALAALSLYTEGLEDYASAVDIYRQLCEEMPEDMGFLDSIEQSGLLSPFEEEIYMDLFESYCK